MIDKKNGYLDLGYLEIARSATEYFQRKYPEVIGYELGNTEKIPKFMRDILTRVVEVVPPRDTIPSRTKSSHRFFLGGRYWYFATDKRLESVRAVFVRPKGTRRWPAKEAIKKIRREFRLMSKEGREEGFQKEKMAVRKEK